MAKRSLHFDSPNKHQSSKLKDATNTEASTPEQTSPTYPSTMAPQHKCNEFETVNAAAEASSASLHGVIASVSPKMIQGKTTDYFEAKLTDGDVQMRVVGFQSSQRKRLASFTESLESVTLQNCQVKKARESDDLEVLLKSS